MTVSRTTNPGRAAQGANPRNVALTVDTEIPGGVVHDLPTDVRDMLATNTTVLGAWRDITPLARNEFICWITDAKQAATRAKRIQVAEDKLARGERRPCCWPGCSHRERTGHA